MDFGFWILDCFANRAGRFRRREHLRKCSAERQSQQSKIQNPKSKIALVAAVCLPLFGCRPAVTAPLRAAGLSNVGAASLPEDGNAPLPLDLDRNALTRSLIDSLQKRVMGRREALRDVARVSTEIRPLVIEAARQPQVENGLRILALHYGLSPGAMREQWVDWQEADLLLEAGGGADAVSPSHAVGVAQWLAGTAKGVGLTVNLADSNRLTGKVDLLKWKVAWAAYRLRPDFNPEIPGNPGYDRAKAEKQLPVLRAELESLRMKRRKVDERYDPRAAVFAQTRYLLRIASRFPSADWLFQAYHGGEGGVKRTLKDFLGSQWPGSTASAIQFGRNGGPLGFEDLYFEATPKACPEAFSYLYGRSDDHRHYWWKLRSAQETLAAYRKDKTAFGAAWEALLPGRSKAALWYPDAASHAFTDFPAIAQAQKSGALVPITSGAGLTVRPPELEPAHAAELQTLRPESRGALLLLNSLYRRAGGTTALEIADLTRTAAIAAQRQKTKILPPLFSFARIYPPDSDLQNLSGVGPPPGFDFHTVGLAFDMGKPADPKMRKILDYALGWCADRQILWHYEEKDFTPPRYVVVPNPRYAAELKKITGADNIPKLPAL